jgi:hypothetical protein
MYAIMEVQQRHSTLRDVIYGEDVTTDFLAGTWIPEEHILTMSAENISQEVITIPALTMDHHLEAIDHHMEVKDHHLEVRT